VVQFLAGEKVVSLLASVQTSSGAHRASCSVGTRGSCPGHRVAGAWGGPHIAIKCQVWEWAELYFHSNHMPSWWAQDNCCFIHWDVALPCARLQDPHWQCTV